MAVGGCGRGDRGLPGSGDPALARPLDDRGRGPALGGILVRALGGRERRRLGGQQGRRPGRPDGLSQHQPRGGQGRGRVLDAAGSRPRPVIASRAPGAGRRCTATAGTTCTRTPCWPRTWPAPETSSDSNGGQPVDRTPEPQRLAAYRQKSRIGCGGVGPASSSWLSSTVTAPVAGITWAAVPVPPTQP